MVPKLAGKEEVLLDLEEDDRLEEYRREAIFVANARTALRAWKAICHTATEKNLILFQQVCSEFGPLLPEDCELRVAAAGDIVRPLLTIALQNNDYSDAGTTCSLLTLQQKGFVTVSGAGVVQTSLFTHLCKQLVRKLHTSHAELSAAWAAAVDGVGEIADDGLRATVTAFTTVFSRCGDQDTGDAGDVAEVTLALEYIANNNKDPLVKNLAVVASGALREVQQGHANVRGASARNARALDLRMRCKAEAVVTVSAGGLKNLLTKWRALWVEVSREHTAWPTDPALAEALEILRGLWDSVVPGYFDSAFTQLCGAVVPRPEGGAEVTVSLRETLDALKTATASLTEPAQELSSTAATWLDCHNICMGGTEPSAGAKTVEFMLLAARLASAVLRAVHEVSPEDQGSLRSAAGVVCRAKAACQTSMQAVDAKYGREMDALQRVTDSLAHTLAERALSVSVQALQDKLRAPFEGEGAESDLFLPDGASARTLKLTDEDEYAVEHQNIQAMAQELGPDSLHFVNEAQFVLHQHVARVAVVRLLQVRLGTPAQVHEFSELVGRTQQMKGGSGAAEQAIHEAVAEAECGDGCLRPINKTCVVHLEKATEAIRRMGHAADSRQALDKGEAEPVTVSWSSMVANAEQYLQRVLGDLRSELQSLAKAWSAFAGSRIPKFEALCEEQTI